MEQLGGNTYHVFVSRYHIVVREEDVNESSPNTPWSATDASLERTSIS